MLGRPPVVRLPEEGKVATQPSKLRLRSLQAGPVLACKLRKRSLLGGVAAPPPEGFFKTLLKALRALPDRAKPYSASPNSAFGLCPKASASPKLALQAKLCELSLLRKLRLRSKPASYARLRLRRKLRLRAKLASEARTYDLRSYVRA